MTTTIQNLDDLQDRRMMGPGRCRPTATRSFILVVSQSSGSVQAANKTYIMSSYSGSITELNIAEGSYVNEGDLIAHIKSTDLDMQQDSIQSSWTSTKSRRASTRSWSSPFRTTRTTSARRTLTTSPITTSTRATRARLPRRPSMPRPIRPQATPTSRSRP